MVTSSQAGSVRADVVRQAASRLFQDAGYSATTMSDIAHAVGVLPGSLYHHFASKEELAIAILEEFDKDLGSIGAAMLARAKSGDEDTETLLADLAADVMEASFAHGAAVGLRAWEAPTASTVRLRDAIVAGARPLERAWKLLIARLASEHPEANIDTSALFAVFTEAATGASASYPPNFDPRKLGKGFCDLLLHGFALQEVDPIALDRSTAMESVRQEVAAWTSVQKQGSEDGADAIIAAARSEFAKRGYDATTIRDIAAMADVGMATLYRRAESKEWLLHQILAQLGPIIDGTTSAALVDGATPIEQLDALGWIFVRFSRRFEEDARILRFSWAERSSPTSRAHDFGIAADRRLFALREAIDRGVAEGSLRRIGSPSEDAIHVRTLVWIRFHDAKRSVEQSHRFLRRTLTLGALGRH